MRMCSSWTERHMLCRLSNTNTFKGSAPPQGERWALSK